uniref:SWIM-type domain-containing protein n=1 Tax=Triticum urartu TaxID=4572 RepID=A0A8R7TKG4_TRIUA
MIDKIKSQLSSRHYSKQQEIKKWDGPICPKIKKRLLKHIEWSSNCYPTNAGEGIFLVTSHGRDYIVELQMKACTCRRWQLTGIPCPHSISCYRDELIDPEEMVHKCYALCNFSKAYARIIMPCKDKREWQKMGGCLIKPPLYENKRGRKAKNRRMQPEEVIARQGGKKITRHGTIIHRSHCNNPEHNKKGCSAFKQGLPAAKPMQKQMRKRSRTTFEEEDPQPTMSRQNEATTEQQAPGPSMTQVNEEPVVTQVTQEHDMPLIGVLHPHSMMEIMRNE